MDGLAAAARSAAHLFVVGLDDTLAVAGEDGHHLCRVLRLQPGQAVTAADGNGTWRPYTVERAGSGAVGLTATGAAVTEPAPRFRTAVAFALTKGDKPELVVQKLTELGVDRILGVVADRSVSRPDDAKSHKMVERWRRVALEASRQSRRARIPEVTELAPLRSLTGHPGLVVAELGGGPVEALGTPPGGELLVAVGPEGGWAPGEVDGLMPWARLDLGPFVLRAETAALAAATLVRTAAFA